VRDANARGGRYVPLEADRDRDPEAYRARLQAYRDSPRLEALVPRVSEACGEWAARCPGQRVAIFCHGSVINVYASQVLGLEPRAFLEASYASTHRFLVSRSGVRSVRSLNETAYLALARRRPSPLQ
jgi:probable phosphoglycerate mutase